jgi:GNAT superfamily N-acetyltransferase
MSGNMIAVAKYKIINLLDMPRLRVPLEQWFVAAWLPWYGPGGQGNAKSDIAEYCERDLLPICLLAIDQNEHAIGTASLKENSVGSSPGTGPWLAAVLVNENLCGQGIGTALVVAIENEAIRLGFKSVWSSTDSAGPILERQGWKKEGGAMSLRGPLDIYRQNF